MVGSHAACTKERLVICLDRACARHAPLPADTKLAQDASPWSWLPLTPQHAAVFGWEKYLDSPGTAEESLAVAEGAAHEDKFIGPNGGYIIDLPDGVESRIRYKRATSTEANRPKVRTEFRISARWNLMDHSEHVRGVARKVAVHFAEKPQATLPIEEEARNVMLGNQVAQSVKAQQCTSDPSLAALHANAAGQQGNQAGLIAVLDWAAGGGKMDAATNLPLITVDHVQSGRRLIDVSVAIRAGWRAELETLGFHADDVDEEAQDGSSLARAVKGHYPTQGFDLPLTQQDKMAPTAVPTVGPEAATGAGDAIAGEPVAIWQAGALNPLQAGLADADDVAAPDVPPP
eukprot:4333782-Karenia_brevis.AAC.1